MDAAISSAQSCGRIGASQAVLSCVGAGASIPARARPRILSPTRAIQLLNMSVPPINSARMFVSLQSS